MYSNNAQVEELQVIDRKDGFFANSKQYIYNADYFKNQEQIAQEQNRSIVQRKPAGSTFRKSIKVTNVRVEGNHNTISFKI